MRKINDEHFESWYRRFYPKLVNSLSCYLGDKNLAKLSADEAIVRAYESWDRVHKMDSPEGWTYRVGLNWAKRKLRRTKLEQLINSKKIDETISEPSGEIWQVVKKLPERQRQAVALRHLAHMTESEVANAMKIKRGTVSATLNQAYKSLQLKISDDFKVKVVEVTQ